MALLDEDLLLIQQAGDIFKLKYSSLKEDVLDGASAVIISDTPPLLPSEGDLWFDTVTGLMYIWYIDADSDQWVSVSGGGGGGGASVDVGDTPPTNATEGDLWFNEVEGRMYIFYVDSNSGQWVDTNPVGGKIDIPSLPTLP